MKSFICCLASGYSIISSQKIKNFNRLTMYHNRHEVRHTAIFKVIQIKGCRLRYADLPDDDRFPDAKHWRSRRITVDFWSTSRYTISGRHFVTSRGGTLEVMQKKTLHWHLLDIC